MDIEPDVTTYSCPESESLLRNSYGRLVPDEKGVLHFTEEQCLEFAGRFCRASCKYPFLFRRHYEVLRNMGEEFGFAEFTRTNEKDDGVFRIVQTVTTNGLLVSEEYVLAIWHFALPDSAIPPELVAIRNRRIPVSHTFKGEKYFLVRAQDRVQAFNLDYFNRLENFLQSLEFQMPAPIESMGLDLKQGR